MKKKHSQVLATGLAMFAMFFGAGNAIFPLTIGYYSQDKMFFGAIGLLITAVIVPFTGLVAMLLYNGDYRLFFARVGKVPGFLIAAAIMAMIGPFGGIPRCVAASFSTLKVVLPGLSSVLFSATACFVIFFFTARKNKIIDLIGYFLTPLLLAFLGWMIIQGLVTADQMPACQHASWDVFTHGLKEGYYTMDLLAAFFFAPLVMTPFQSEGKKGYSQILKASALGGGLLALTYVGFCLITAFHGSGVSVGGSEELIGAVAVLIIGPSAGFVVACLVALACLTTAIALTSVFAEFLQEVIFLGRISYITAVVGTLFITFLLSTLEFSGIVALLAPILQVCYPGLIVLTVVNLLIKAVGERRFSSLFCRKKEILEEEPGRIS